MTYRDRANIALLDGSIAPAERNIEPLKINSLAIGKLFTDETILPGEKLERKIIVQLPEGYPAIDIDLLLPVLSRAPEASLFKGKQLRWGYQPPDFLFPRLCSGEGENQACANVDRSQLSDAIEAFDHRSTVFTRSIQVPL
jgi:hypothetical protein